VNFQVSARKWRPKTFDEVVGQKHLIRVLSNAISQGEIAHAYLFSGTRGVGKTTVARILAKAINCANTKERLPGVAPSPGTLPPQGTLPLVGTVPPCGQCVSCKAISSNASVDVMEIDGASNTSVDDVRDLREKVKYLPLSGKYKVYIIDEAHMLSNAAFNALLKTLEEPPAHLVFILATTEAHKIPATILSRCQHLIFRRVSRIEIEAQLRKIILEKDVQMSDRVLTFIAKAAEGSLRDALSLCDQAISYSGNNVTEQDLATLFGRAGGTTFHALTLGIAEKNADALLMIAREIENGGYDLRQFISDWIERLRHLIVIKNVKDASVLIDLPDEEKKEIESEAALFSKEALLSLFSTFIKLQDEIRNAPRPHLLLEVALMKASLIADLTPIEKIIEEIRGQTNISTPMPTAVRLEKPIPKAILTPPVGASPLQDTATLWKNLLLEVKKTRPNLASYLDQGVFVAVLERTIQLRFSEESFFLISLIEKEENKKLLQPLIKRYFGKDLMLAFEAINEGNAPISEKRNAIVEEALRIFGGEIVQTK
jgi:DNA polymerase-3 subunit gamma/tau